MAAIVEQGFVLHTVPWRETSLVIELFTREHGRVAVMAKGARRPRSTLRSVLLQFQPIDLAYMGRNELKTLTRAEWRGGVPLPQGDSLLVAFYLNELLVRLLPREDPHPRLFDGYEATLIALGSAPDVAADGDRERALRRFEWLLLQEIGYAPDLARDRDGRPIDETGHYRIVSGEWLAVDEPAADASRADVYSGAALRGIASGSYDGPGVLGQAKRLSRQVLGEHLDGTMLYTRRILLDLHRME